MAPTNGAAAVAPADTNKNDEYTVAPPIAAAPPPPTGVPQPPAPAPADLPASTLAGNDTAAAPADDVLTGDELTERARELDIKGRSSMDADELRDAIAAKEADLAASEGLPA